MKKHMLTLIFAALLLAFQSCNKISGNGPEITKTFTNADFSSVYAGLDADVYVTQDNNYKVEIHAQANIMDMIETHVVNGELQLQYEKFKNIGRHDRVVVYISAPSISGLGVNGSGNLFATQPITSSALNLRVNGSGNVSVTNYTGSDLSANISGSGRITVSGGTVNSEDLHISGSGTIDMLGIPAQHVTTNTSGSGNTSVNVTNSLNVRISGSGDVFYTGYPSVNTSISGSGKVHHI